MKKIQAWYRAYNEIPMFPNPGRLKRKLAARNHTQNQLNRIRFTTNRSLTRREFREIMRTPRLSARQWRNAQKALKRGGCIVGN